MKKITIALLVSLNFSVIAQTSKLDGIYVEYKETLLNGEDGSKYTFNQKPFVPALQMTFYPEKSIVIINNDGYESNQLYTVNKNMLTTKMLVKNEKSIDTAYASYIYEIVNQELVLKEYKKGFNEKHFLKVYYFKKSANKADDKKEPENIYSAVDESASFPGGMEEFRKFVMKELELPKNIKEKKFKEKVYLKITISETGKITNCDYLGYPRLEFAFEAMNLVRKLPNWEPAKINGKKVAAYFNLPLLFNQE